MSYRSSLNGSGSLGPWLGRRPEKEYPLVPLNPLGPQEEYSEPRVTIEINTANPGSGGPLPAIETAARQTRDIVDDAIEAVADANHPPTIFRHAGGLVRLHDGGEEGVQLVPLRRKILRRHLGRVADWFHKGVAKGVPEVVVNDIEAAPEDSFSTIPGLDAVVTFPVATRQGLIITQPGYHPGARLWYTPDPDLPVPRLPAHLSSAHVALARGFIHDHLLVDFPFVDETDRAVAWAALMLPFVRPLIAGPTPLHLIMAPTPGTGKTLLAKTLMVPALGRREIPSMTVDCEEPEIRRRLTSSLRKAPTAILLDNLGQGRRLVSSSLASILTTGTWSDRLLGSSTMASLPIRCVWLATGNNPRLSQEMQRRAILARLDPVLARPHLRTEFKHQDLLAWARAQRSLLLQAILTLVQGWLTAGQPQGDVRLGGYESWCQVIGGILEVAGIPGLRQAIERDQGRETDMEQAITPFVRAWWRQYGSATVGVKDLYEVAVAAGCLEEMLAGHQSPQQPQRCRGPETERAKQTRLGIVLRCLNGQVFAGYQIQSVGTDHSGRQLYRLYVPKGKPKNLVFFP